jgi:hypothetical protein
MKRNGRQAVRPRAPSDRNVPESFYISMRIKLTLRRRVATAYIRPNRNTRPIELPRARLLNRCFSRQQELGSRGER